jgi:autotransporter-associated beta strand protein
LGRAQVEIESFHNFNPDNYYDAWLDPPPFTTITSAPTYWETASTEGYGSCYYGYYTDNGGAHIDATGEGMLQLSFTINSGDAGMFVDMDDGEGDEWQWMMGGFGLTPGTYVIDEPLNDPSLKEMVASSNLPPTGFDFSQITGMNFELDPGATNGNPNPYDVSWTDLSAVNPNLTWNNANYTNLKFLNATADGMTWDSANNLNWNNGTNSSVYADGAYVTFNDNNNGNNAVTLNTTVRPGSVTINNTLASYTFSGTGSIAGTASLTKTGTGMATISTANTFTGGTTVSNGSLVLGNPKALGFGGIVTGNPGGTSVTTGGTLDLGGQTITQPITLNGGSLINSNTSTPAGVSSGVLGDGIVSTTALSGDASVSFTGPGTGAAATPVLGIGVATFTITNGGSGYLNSGRSFGANPTVTVTGGGGTGAILGAITNTAGVVTSIDIYSPGIGFTSAPTITISAPGAGGTQATVATSDLFTLLGIEQTAPGTGYYTAPSAAITASSGSATLGTPVISGVILAGTGNIGGPGNINLAGTVSGVGMLDKIGSGTVTLSAPNTYSGGTTVTAGKLLIEPTSPTTSALPKGALSITGGEVQLATNVTQGSQSANPPSTAPASNVNITSLSISGTGTLDIGNNHLIVDYSGSDPIASIAALIAHGAYAGGTTITWTGTGITSSAAQLNSSSYGIGYADTADAGNPAGLSSGQIEIMYTLLGDANLDGKVNGTDFNLMATNFNQSVTAGWDKGDFNYDGKVNGNDFVLLAANFNQFASQSATSSADTAALDAFAQANGIALTDVPEPTSALLCVAAGLGALSRRRRKV